MNKSSLMTPSEGRRILRLVLAASGGFVISVVGVVLTLVTGSQTVGWSLVPGGMMALAEMHMNAFAGMWMYFGTVANVAIWTLVLLTLGRRIRERHPRAVA